jgi:O-antigen/teichoic acid export membrane protein
MSRLGRVELLYVVLHIAMSYVGFLVWGVHGLALAAALAALTKTLLARAACRSFTREVEVQSAPLRINTTRAGLYSIVRNGLSNGLSNLDVILLGQAQSPDVVALYKVGKSLASLPIKASFPLWRVLQPRLLSAIHAGDRVRERRVVLTGSIGFGLLLVAMLPFILWFGADLIALTFGEGFRGAFGYFLILMVGVWLFNGMAGWFAFWSVVTESQVYGIAVYAVAFLLLLVGGVSVAADSAERMAVLVSTSMMVAAGLAYLGLFFQSRARTKV